MAAIPALRLCALSDELLDPAIFLAAIADPAAGGHDLFLGTVRDHADGRAVASLDYSAHPNALAEMERVAGEVLARHEVIAAAIGHRVGPLAIGDIAVVCAVSAAHRDAAFAACRDLIDEVKARVPIWKHEHFTDGTSVWVGSGMESDASKR